MGEGRGLGCRIMCAGLSPRKNLPLQHSEGLPYTPYGKCANRQRPPAHRMKVPIV